MSVWVFICAFTGRVMDSAHMDRIIWMFRTEPEIRFDETFVISTRIRPRRNSFVPSWQLGNNTQKWPQPKISTDRVELKCMGIFKHLETNRSFERWPSEPKLPANYSEDCVSGVKYDHQANCSTPDRCISTLAVINQEVLNKSSWATTELMLLKLPLLDWP